MNNYKEKRESEADMKNKDSKTEQPALHLVELDIKKGYTN